MPSGAAGVGSFFCQQHAAHSHAATHHFSNFVFIFILKIELKGEKIQKNSSGTVMTFPSMTSSEKGRGIQIWIRDECDQTNKSVRFTKCTSVFIFIIHI